MSEPKSNNFLASMKMASQRFAGVVADTGAKAMLKTDVVFLERDIAARKHALGVEVYDILQTTEGPASSERVQRAFEECRSDIQHLESKVNTKKREMEAIDGSNSGGGGGGVGGVGGGGGGGATRGVGGMDDAEIPGIPSTP